MLIDKCDIFNISLYRNVQDFSDSNGNIFKINLIDDFNGVVVHLISNDHGLIENIQNLYLAPPLPSVSFPKIDPEEFGSLQGNIDFWFSWLWLPYWKSLTKEQQKKFTVES